MTEKDEADRLFKLMRSITFDKNDAKDCAIICAQELSNNSQAYGIDEYYNKVINEVKKI